MKVDLQALIAKSNGRFFSLTFTKKDGTTRVVNGKNKDLATLKGGTYKAGNAGYVAVWDRNAQHYVSVHPSRVKEFRCNELVARA